MREPVEYERIRLTYCPTDKMAADIFTKAPPQPAFTRHNLGLELFDESISTLHKNQTDSGDTYNNVPEVRTDEGRYCELPERTRWCLNITPSEQI